LTGKKKRRGYSHSAVSATVAAHRKILGPRNPG